MRKVGMVVVWGVSSSSLAALIMILCVRSSWSLRQIQQMGRKGRTMPTLCFSSKHAARGLPRSASSFHRPTQQSRGTVLRSKITSSSLSGGDEDGYNNNNNNNSSKDEDSDDDNDDTTMTLQEVLRLAEERALDDFIQNEAPAWIQSSHVIMEEKTMPFQCTACGRCCQTEGDVYMDPEEIQQVAKRYFSELSPVEFVQEYASHILGPSKRFDETSTWIKLREVNGSCVFLEPDGKQCSIYEARPVQCRTYPFWPTIMESMQSWDSECRRMDDDQYSPLPQWTPANGGCEGMQTIEAASLSTSSGGDVGAAVEGVPIREAYRQLYEYTISDRRFPKGKEKRLPNVKNHP